MTIIGISVDDVDDSRRLAEKEHIHFALASDPDLAVARAYVGVDDHDLAVPGIVLIRPDGTIGFRRISRDKADRPTLAAVLADIDRALGLAAAAPRLHGGYGALERVQLTLDLGGGAARRDDDWGGLAVAGITALYPLSQHLLAGAMAGGALGDGTRADLALVLGARVPFFHDLGAVQLELRGGGRLGDDDGLAGGARTRLLFAVTPSWGLSLAAGAGLTRDTRDTFELTGSLGITRLVRVR